MRGSRLRPSSNEHHRGATGETMGREANDDPRPAVRQALPTDADVVQAISAGAYASAYLPVIGAVPKPASEDYRPRIDRGEVWLLEAPDGRSEEHTSELQSLMRISYAVFCLKKKNTVRKRD